MDQALLYRNGGKKPLAVAFACATIVHISAIALAEYRYDAATVVPVEDLFGPPVILENWPTVEPPPDPDLAPPPPPDMPTNDFIDFTPPRPHHAARPVGPIRPPGAQVSRPGNPKAMALSAPRPEYPYEARSRHVMGSGVARLTLDPGGRVTSAVMSQSTGSPILDGSALSAFRRWSFRPGTPSPVVIPITYTLTGASY